MNIYNDDCFNVFPKIENKTIDLFVLDLPYANKDFGKCTACKWDNTIDLDKMWVEIKRIMKPNAVILFYCNTKFGFSLIKSNMKWFRYDLIWKKSRKVGFLSANKMPLRQHENIYVFGDADDDLENNKNKELREYAEQVKKYIGKTKTEIVKEIGQTIDHFFRIKSSQFGIPTEETYNKLIETYKIDEMEGLIDYKTLKGEWEKEMVNTYNPQKTEGKPYKSKEHIDAGYYRKDSNYKRTATKDTTNRHPTSIIEHENIYIFSDYMDHNTEINNKHIIDYSKQILKYIGKTKAEIKRNIKDADHFFRYSKDNFSMPTEETYNKLIAFYKIDKMKPFIDYKTLKSKWEKEMVNTYNPQKTEGKPYIVKEHNLNNEDVYNQKKVITTINKGDRHPTSIIEHENVYVFKDKGGTYNPQKTKGEPYIKDRKGHSIEKGIYGNNDRGDEVKENKGDRHPTSIYPDTIETTILEHNNPHKTLHRTQKPTSLCEWLIKTYSNEGDVVMDFTMGSGTTGEACINTKRKFIGVEMDKEIFEIAENRLNKTNKG